MVLWILPVGERTRGRDRGHGDGTSRLSVQTMGGKLLHVRHGEHAVDAMKVAMKNYESPWPGSAEKDHSVPS